MIRLLNILFFGLAVLFFAVLTLAMYKSVRYVNANQAFILSQKTIPIQAPRAKSDTLTFPLSGNDTTTAEELPEIDFAAIDSLLDDEDELDSLIQMTVEDEGIVEEMNSEGRRNERTKDEGQKDEEAKILNKKPKNEVKKIAKAKTPTKNKATPASYNQSGKYYIAVGAFKDRKNANVVQNQLKKLGFKNIKRIKNNTFTLIRLQGYPKKSAAANDLTKVRKHYKEAYIRKR